MIFFYLNAFHPGDRANEFYLGPCPYQLTEIREYFSEQLELVGFKSNMPLSSTFSTSSLYLQTNRHWWAPLPALLTEILLQNVLFLHWWNFVIYSAVYSPIWSWTGSFSSSLVKSGQDKLDLWAQWLVQSADLALLTSLVHKQFW